MSKIKICVLGNKGFLGSKIVARLCRNPKFKILPMIHKGDFTKLSHCRRAVRGADIVIHAAGLVTSRMHQSEHPAEIFYTNSLLTFQVFEACRREKVPNVITFSSSTAFSVSGKSRVGISDLFESIPHINGSFGFYGMSRWLVPFVAHAYAAEYGMRSRVIVFPNLYGPGDKFDHAVPPLVANLIREVDGVSRRGEKIFFGGNNKEQRIDLLYIDDAVDLVERIAMHPGGESVLCVTAGSGTSISIGRVVETIAREAHFKGKISWIEGPVSSGIVLHNREVSLRWRWKPKTSFTAGVRQTLHWFFEHHGH
ncbi:MAG: NAD(P)-dependent oxidoreductase [Patescibacteria group bacterium]|nr:NAD(P)-dependent oxidoreductase [Patescibacteria group bacterium]